MSHASSVAGTDIHAYLHAQEHKSLLRFITCGSVDDGKSTLIGRLLYDSKLLFDDHLAALRSDSRRWGTQGDDLDFALLVDGLAAEREQGITIDVAYRFFSTERRKYIVADTPGHEQYTRNMATGASTADAAVLVVDARKGVLPQTRRHACIAGLLGIRHVVVAVNKMDLLGYDADAFDAIRSDFDAFAQGLAPLSVTCIPISALRGDNVRNRSSQMAWYAGPTLMEYLEQVEVEDVRQAAPFRMPVQWVNRSRPDFRGHAGRVAAGTVQIGDTVRVLPSGRETTVAAILGPDGDLERAVAGQSVTLRFQDDVDAGRGDMVASGRAPAEVAHQFEATVVWMHDEPLLPGRTYLLKIGAATASASVMEIRYQLNVDTFEHVAARTLGLNAIGVCTLHLDRPIAFDAYAENRETGGFVLIDRFTHATVAAGMLRFALRRSHNIHLQQLVVDKQARGRLNRQRPCVVWFTGLSGAGKSTLANALDRRLHALGHRTYLLDGDNVRLGLNRDLGFTDPDRVENIRRVAEVARLMVDAGLIVLASFISPFRAERQMARDLLMAGEFFEIHVDVPVEVAEARDPKGLYRKARQGLLKNFTGIDSRYEAPEQPELRIAADRTTPDDGVQVIIDALERAGVLQPVPEVPQA